MKLPTLSVITINYNDGHLLEATMVSVFEQEYPYLEYIVVDGGSTDNSLEIISKYENKLAKWVSQADKGIYDAMNKGAALASGDYLNFMNAGDRFVSPKVLSEVFEKAETDAALIYGDHEVVYPNFTKQKQGQPASGLWKHMMFSHQALFCKRELLLAHPFELRFRIAADFHFIYNRYREGQVFCHVPVKVVSYRAGGQSEIQVLNAYSENARIVTEHDHSLKVKIFHFKLWVKQWFLVQLNSLLPQPFFLLLMKWKNRFIS